MKTDYGTIRFGGVCKDDYSNIGLYDQQEKGWAVVKLQEPALRSLKDCERRWAKLTTPWQRRRHIRVTGSWRACSYQAQLYALDPKRYAHPNSGVHTRGLAIDVYWRGVFTKLILKRILRNHGWHQSRPDDEPWHWSFGVTA
jgi:hypothetical protein